MALSRLRRRVSRSLRVAIDPAAARGAAMNAARSRRVPRRRHRRSGSTRSPSHDQRVRACVSAGRQARAASAMAHCLRTDRCDSLRSERV